MAHVLEKDARAEVNYLDRGHFLVRLVELDHKILGLQVGVDNVLGLQVVEAFQSLIDDVLEPIAVVPFEEGDACAILDHFVDSLAVVEAALDLVQGAKEGAGVAD